MSSVPQIHSLADAFELTCELEELHEGWSNQVAWLLVRNDELADAFAVIEATALSMLRTYGSADDWLTWANATGYWIEVLNTYAKAFRVLAAHQLRLGPGESGDLSGTDVDFSEAQEQRLARRREMLDLAIAEALDNAQHQAPGQ